ncbi:MAG: hypothetical protein KDK40_00375 [Chlamydiia bacterium]|nr:hypothetical protein [Chlamydiia bacterium]
MTVSNEPKHISFSQLGGNLQCLVEVADEPKLLSRVVPGLFTDTLTTRGVYRWCQVIIYKFLNLLLGKNYMSQRLKEVVERTHATYVKTVNSVHQGLFERDHLLSDERNGKGIDTKKWRQINHTLWSTCELLNWASGGDEYVAMIQKIERAVAELFSEMKGDLEAFRHFQGIWELEHLQNHRALFRLEQASGESPPPYPSLLLLLRSKSNGKAIGIDEKKIAEWIDRLERSDISSNTLHSGLCNLVETLWIGSEKSRIVAQLELKLRDRGLTRLDQIDPKNLEIRRIMEAKALYETPCGLSYSIGHRMGKKTPQGDSRATYVLKEDPSRLIVAAGNRALLGMREEEIRSQEKILPGSFQLPLVEKLDDSIDLLERFQKPLAGGLAEGEQQGVQIRLLQILLRSGFIGVFDGSKSWGLDLRVEDFMIDQLGMIRRIRPWRLTNEPRGDVDRLTEFVAEVANGNWMLFRVLTSSNEFKNSLTTRYYARVVDESLLRGEKSGKSAEEIAREDAFRAHIPSTSLDQAVKLQERLRKLVFRCSQRILSYYDVDESSLNKVRESVKNSIKVFYQTRWGCGRFYSKEDEMILAVADSLRLSPRQVFATVITGREGVSTPQ